MYNKLIFFLAIILQYLIIHYYQYIQFLKNIIIVYLFFKFKLLLTIFSFYCYHYSIHYLYTYYNKKKFLILKY